MARKKKSGTGQNLIFAGIVLVLLVGLSNVGISLFVEAPERPDIPCIPVNETRDQGDFKCSDEFEAAQTMFDEEREDYGKVFFIVSIVLALIYLAVGFFLPIKGMSWGVMASGLVQAVWGTTRYWDFMPKTLRFIMLLVALALAVAFGFKFMEKD